MPFTSPPADAGPGQPAPGKALHQVIIATFPAFDSIWPEPVAKVVVPLMGIAAVNQDTSLLVVGPG